MLDNFLRVVMWACFAVLVAMAVTGCAVLPQPGQVGSTQWLYDNAEYFHDVAADNLARCQVAGKTSCIWEERDLHQAQFLIEAAGYSAMLKSGFIK